MQYTVINRNEKEYICITETFCWTTEINKILLVSIMQCASSHFSSVQLFAFLYRLFCLFGDSTDGILGTSWLVGFLLVLASQVALVVENPACHCGRPKTCRFHPWVGKIPWRGPYHSRVLAWRISWREEPGRLQSMELQRVGQNWSDLKHTA